MLGYNFEILYKPGVDNKAADGLSCIEQTEVNTTVLLLALTVPSFVQLQDIYMELDLDDYIQRLVQQCNEGTVSKKGYTIIQERLFYKGLMVLPRESIHIPLILHEYHDVVYGGYS